ncbi:hypothetical protein P7C70_g1877, partial [Phenoliferia sp. Uapishka_3]
MKQDFSIMYAALATTLSLQLGLHRPLHTQEYFLSDLGLERTIDPSSNEGAERRIAWHLCHIINYSLSADHGYPSQIQDDWANLTAASSGPTTFAPLPLVIVQRLRLSRFSDRVSRALGGCVDTPSGVPSPQTSTSLLRAFSAELTDLERSIGSVDTSERLLSLLTSVRLCVFGLQIEPASGPQTNAGRSQLASECYVGCIRIIDIVLGTDPLALGKFPMGLLWGFGQACNLQQITLIHLVTGSDARKFDVPAALIKISEAYRISLSLAVEDGDIISRFANHLGFAARRAHERLGATSRSKDGSSATAPSVSRLGVPNWIYDSAKQARLMEAEMRQAQAARSSTQDHQTIRALEGSYSDQNVANATAPFDAPGTSAVVYSHDQFNDILSAFWSDPLALDPAYGNGI